MNIKSSYRYTANQKTVPTATKPGPNVVEADKERSDRFEASRPDGMEFGPRLLGGFVGAIVGGIAGAAGGQSAMLASGVGAGVVTAATLGPHLSQAVKTGLTGDPLNDVALTSSAVFAGGVTLSAFSAAAGLGAFAAEQALPGAGRLVSAVMGAAAGASIGIWN